MIPQDRALNRPEYNWCLGEAGVMYLVYALVGGPITLDLSGVTGTFRARWFDPRTGMLRDDATRGRVSGGEVITFTAPGADDWALWLTTVSAIQGEQESGTKRR